MRKRRIERWALGGLLGLSIGACGPISDMSPCDEDRPCDGRGLVCDLETLECVTADVDTSSTESPAPANFADVAIPFFRGEVCLPHEVQSGSPLPILMRPCLHSCITPTSYQFKHTFSCVGSRCEALAMMWVIGTGTNCPPDAFGQFDASQCQYPTEVGLAIGTSTSNGPISGTMEIEVPFLSNADTAIIADGASDEEVRDLVEQYPADPGRIPDTVSLLADNPVPPASCAGGVCPCHSIGL